MPRSPGGAKRPRTPGAGGPSAHVALGEVARPHGIRGELRIKVYNEDSNLLLAKPPIVLALADGSERAAKIASARPTNKAVLVELVGVVDRNAAEALRGAWLMVPRDALPALDDGEFYACDLEGAKAMLGEELIGRVKSIQNYPTCDVLLIDRGARGLLEVPLVDAYVASVDAAAGVVQLVTIDGLG